MLKNGAAPFIIKASLAQHLYLVNVTNKRLALTHVYGMAQTCGPTNQKDSLKN